ncbi:MAG: hypothetical protein HOJ52_01070, partial [Candidatus Thioglobus sp.]|nr:hypothetical protein [Candidatus Thioglobus sp.]
MLIRIIKTNTILSLLFVFLLQGVANSQETDSKKLHGIPVGSIMVQFSPENNDERSSALGIELQGNFKISESFVFGVHANLQEQTYGDIAPVRAGGGVSLNYYKRLNTMTTFVGIKRTYYDEWIAKTQDALDCLYCSNVLQDYSGMEDFATVGINFGDWIVQLDKRISDNGSKFTES